MTLSQLQEHYEDVLADPHVNSSKDKLRRTDAPDGKLHVYRGFLGFSDDRRLGVQETIETCTDARGEDALSHSPSAGNDYSRRFRFRQASDGGREFLRIEDEIHGLHFHNYDESKDCCSVEYRRVEIKEGKAGFGEEHFCFPDAAEAILRSYYRDEQSFCKEIGRMGYVRKAERGR